MFMIHGSGALPASFLAYLTAPPPLATLWDNILVKSREFPVYTLHYEQQHAKQYNIGHQRACGSLVEKHESVSLVRLHRLLARLGA